MAILPQSFYTRPTLLVAQELIGKVLCRKVDNKLLAGIIVETEAYHGWYDDACHGHKGKTPRCEVMFKKGGYAYVYFTYGFYYMLNVVTFKKDFPSAVLIRSIVPIYGIKQMINNRLNKFSGRNKKTVLNNLANGPGKLAIAMQIDNSLNGEFLVASNKLWIQDGIDGMHLDTKSKYMYNNVIHAQIRRTDRIGIDYATVSRKWTWRCIVPLGNGL